MPHVAPIVQPCDLQYGVVMNVQFYQAPLFTPLPLFAPREKQRCPQSRLIVQVARRRRRPHQVQTKLAVVPHKRVQRQNKGRRELPRLGHDGVWRAQMEHVSGSKEGHLRCVVASQNGVVRTEGVRAFESLLGDNFLGRDFVGDVVERAAVHRCLATAKSSKELCASKQNLFD